MFCLKKNELLVGIVLQAKNTIENNTYAQGFSMFLCGKNYLG
jgi:hypothetical protein